MSLIEAVKNVCGLATQEESLNALYAKRAVLEEERVGIVREHQRAIAWNGTNHDRDVVHAKVKDLNERAQALSLAIAAAEERARVEAVAAATQDAIQRGLQSASEDPVKLANADRDACARYFATARKEAEKAAKDCAKAKDAEERAARAVDELTELQKSKGGDSVWNKLAKAREQKERTALEASGANARRERALERLNSADLANRMAEVNCLRALIPEVLTDAIVVEAIDIGNRVTALIKRTLDAQKRARAAHAVAQTRATEEHMEIVNPPPHLRDSPAELGLALVRCWAAGLIVKGKQSPITIRALGSGKHAFSLGGILSLEFGSKTLERVACALARS